MFPTSSRLAVLLACLLPLVVACGDDDAGDGGPDVDETADDAGRDDGAGDDNGSDENGDVPETVDVHEVDLDADAADADADGDAGDADGDDGDVPPTGDEEWLWRALRGEVTPEEALLAVARSNGWPIRTADGYLFALLDDGAGPYQLTGDPTAWTGIDMTLDHGLWWVRSVVPDPIDSLYKFVSGGGTVYRADPYARRYGYDTNGEFSLVEAAAPHLERWPEVTDGVVLPRTVRAWVPAGTVRRHLYVHDGQNLFDPSAPWGGWHLQDVLGPETLAVGIDNTSARMDEYTPVPDDIDGSGVVGGQGDAYADFVEETVRPLIEAQYGTPERVGVMGSSLGGLIAFHEALRFPGAYDFAASLSGTFGWGSIGLHNETLIERLAAAGHGTTVLYLDSGGGAGSGCIDSDGDGIQDDTPDAEDNFCETRQLADTLASVGYVYDVDLHHWFEPGAEHDEAAWAARVFRPVDIFESL